MKQLKNIIKNKQLPNSPTVNSKDKYSNTVNSNKTNNEKIGDFLEQLSLPPEGIAKTLAEALDDLNSLRYYSILVKENGPNRLFEALSYVKDADKRGRIRINKAVYFQAILRNWGIQTKFKKEQDG